MSREIKFRAWDTILKEFVYAELPHGNPVIKLTSHHGMPPINDLENWQMCINLKDKNGVEIYEGDILIHENPTRGHGTNKEVRTVRWENDSVGFNLVKGMTLKIIGNIYE